MPSSSDDDDEDSCARGMALAALKRFLGFSIEHCRREGQKQRSLLTWETVGGSDAWESRRRRGLGSAVDGLRPCRQVAGGTLGELSAVDVVSRVYIRNNLNPKFRARVRRGALIRVFDVVCILSNTQIYFDDCCSVFEFRGRTKKGQISTIPFLKDWGLL